MYKIIGSSLSQLYCCLWKELLCCLPAFPPSLNILSTVRWINVLWIPVTSLVYFHRIKKEFSLYVNIFCFSKVVFLLPQRMWQRGVNSDAVLRQTGRPPVNGVGRGRGGSVDRGRGRGRGTGSYYSRGLSYDEEAEPRGPREGGTMTLGMGIR